MEPKDWIVLASCLATVVTIFWKSLFGGEKEVRAWAEREFVRRELFDLHQDQVAQKLEAFEGKIVSMHEDNRTDRATDRALMLEILKAVGGNMPQQRPSRRDRPSDPGR